MTSRETVLEIWPEIEWIQDPDLREKVLRTWLLGFERSPLGPEDLKEIPFTLHVPNCRVTFLAHKRLVVHLALACAVKIEEFMGKQMPVDRDTLIAGAILADVGKLLEYEKVDGRCVQSRRGQLLRHPFTGVALARECGVPDEVCHVIAAHAGEGDLIRRSAEAFIVHHADFMTYEPLVKGLDAEA
ncbi:MAG: HDIG domain-containing protein [Planctomycetota bacterium]|nr:MAG: HDIG domain-containing protein [Planctomycetota bacterium]